MKKLLIFIALLFLVQFTSYAQPSPPCPSCDNNHRDSTVTSLTVDKTLSNEVSVFPNPATSVITIDLDNSLKFNEAQISFVSMRGEISLQRSTSNLSNQKLDISSLRPGLYIVRIKTSDKLLIKRLVKR